MEPLSVKIAAEGILRRWPDAVDLQLDHSGQRYKGLVPVAVLDADGEELDDMKLWDGLDNGAHVPSLIVNLPTTKQTGRSTAPCSQTVEITRTAARAEARVGGGDDAEGDQVEHRRAGLQPPSASRRGSGRAEPWRVDAGSPLVRAPKFAFRPREGQKTVDLPNDDNCNYRRSAPTCGRSGACGCPVSSQWDTG